MASTQQTPKLSPQLEAVPAPQTTEAEKEASDEDTMSEFIGFLAKTDRNGEFKAAVCSGEKVVESKDMSGVEMTELAEKAEPKEPQRSEEKSDSNKRPAALSDEEPPSKRPTTESDTETQAADEEDTQSSTCKDGKLVLQRGKSVVNSTD